jgi:uncharacterized iron-regulated membrane protein
MKEGFRQCAAWLHTWTGLVVGWVLFFVFVTGTAGYFQAEITRWMQPERPMVRPLPLEDRAATVAMALERLEQVAPGAAGWRITLPHQSLAPRGWQGLSIDWEEMPLPGHREGAEGSEDLDPATGSILPPGPEPRATAGGHVLYKMHYLLRYMPISWGIYLVGVCTMLMLLAIATGVITHKKIFKDFFTFRPGKGQRSWLDAHNAISVMALPFFLMITYSGLMFFLGMYMPAGKHLLYGPGAAGERAFYRELIQDGPKTREAVARPGVSVPVLIAQAEAAWGPGTVASLAIEHPSGEPPAIVITGPRGRSLDFREPPTMRFHADTGEPLAPEPVQGGAAYKTWQVQFNLHEGLFVGIWGRWLYFVAGLLGCAMIGTGLVLWTVKRRRHLLAAGLAAREHLGLRLVETLNVATIAGLPLAVAAYFWANRLLPVQMADRPEWEIHSLFAVWLGSLFYALARPLHRAWIELLWAACAAYALVPMINALTTHRHLLNTLPDRDWVFAGFDLTMWGLAAMLAVMAVKVQRRLAPVMPASSQSVEAPAAWGRGTS